MPSWLCSPSNADCQTSATSPLSLPRSWISLTVCLLLRENASVSSALRAADNVLGSPTLTATASSGAHRSLWEGEGGSQALWLCFCAGSGDYPTAATPISAWSLLRSLTGFSHGASDPSGRNAHLIVPLCCSGLQAKPGSSPLLARELH